MMKILVTGFDPFGGESINPAIEAVKRLPDVIGGAEIIKQEIPTSCLTSLQLIEKLLIRNDPDVILSVGQAGGRAAITVERIGINIDDFGIKDNDGNQLSDVPIFADGPDAYFLNLPIKKMVERIQDSKIPAAVSNTAGTFVCNHVAYGTRYLIERKYPGKRSGFIHIPYLPEQTVNKPGMPSMALEMIVEGLTAAIEAIVDYSVPGEA